MDLHGKTAIVTGSGRGIGRRTAITLAGEGCNVVLVSRTQKEVQEVEKTIRNKGGEAFHLAADISKKKDIEHVINQTLKKYDSLEILVNNAGVHFASPFLETTEEDGKPICRSI